MLPDLDEEKILSVHSLSKPLSSEVDLGIGLQEQLDFEQILQI